MPTILEVAWQRYLTQLDRRPLSTKAITAGAISGLSDALAQRMTTRMPWNWRRTAAMALFGFVWSGPSNHYWQAFVQRLLGSRRDDTTAIKKVLLDQLTYGPVCNVVMMAYIALVIEGRSWNATYQKIVRDYPSVQQSGWRVWPLASLVNYKFVPYKLRVLFVNLVAFCWSTFLITRARTASLLTYAT